MFKMKQKIRALFAITTTLSFLVKPGQGVVLDCYKTTFSAYHGHQQTTASGKPCLRWDQFDLYSANDFPDSTVYDAANYCRAPDGYYTLWCLISEDADWEECGIFKCGDDVLTGCGLLRVESPTVIGRNLTFSFTLYTFDPNATLYWIRKANSGAEWSTLDLNYKFTQNKRNMTYHLVSTDSLKVDDEQIYGVIYYNGKNECVTKTRKLELKGTACGHVQLRSKRIIRNEIVQIEYYPPNIVLANPKRFTRQWIHFKNKTPTRLTLEDGHYEEEVEQGDIYVLTIFSFRESMKGDYRVYCGNEATYTNFVTLEIKDPPSLPIIQGLQDIDNCTDCIVSEVQSHFNVSCAIENGSRPLQVTMKIGNEFHTLNPFNETSTTYYKFLALQEHHHMKNISFSVSNVALTSPLTVTANVYIIKPSSLHTFSVPDTLTEGEAVNITCTMAIGRPSPNVYFNISGSKLSSEAVHTTISSDKIIIFLTTFKREWSGENLSCCRYNKWYKNDQECFPPKQVDYLYRPTIKFNISGSELKITKGKKEYVECLVDSFPASNISWTEELSNAKVTKKKCDMASKCILPIDSYGVLKRLFLCSTNYLKIVDHKRLTVYIKDKEEEGYREKQNNNEPASNNLTIWIILGCALIAGTVIAVFIFVVFNKRRRRNTEKKESRVSYNSSKDKTRNSQHRSEESLQGNLNVAEQDIENAEEVPEYSKPVKKKKKENVCKTNVQGNKAGTSAGSSKAAQPQRVEDGQLLYADLDFDPNENPEKRQSVLRRDSQTEYADIDYVKTKAQQNTDDKSEVEENIYANQ